MRETSQLDTALPVAGVCEQCFVAGIIVHEQMAAPVFQKLAGMLTASSRLIVEDDESWLIFLKIITAVGPQIGFAGFALARVKLRHRRFIGMQGIALQQMPNEAIHQGL